MVAVIAGSPTARNLAGAETEEYRSDDEIWATALSVFFILLLLLLLLLFLLFRRDAAKRDKSYLAAATKEFWWGLEEEVEVTGPNVAELKARRSAKLLAGEIDKEVMTRACRLLVLELADLAVAESRFKTHVRRDMELSRQIHITRTVVDRFSAAQRDIAKNTTDMGTRHEHHSRKVDEAIEAVREELRLLDEVGILNGCSERSISLSQVPQKTRFSGYLLRKSQHAVQRLNLNLRDLAQNLKTLPRRRPHIPSNARQMMCA